MASNIFNWFKPQQKAAIAVDSLSEQTRDGINKAFIPKFLYKPPYGYPRFANMGYVRYLATTPYVDMCIKTIIDELASIEWDIVSNDGMEELSDEAEIENIRNFFLNPNTNHETFEQVFIRMPVRDLLEVNSGVLNKVYNMKGELVEVVARDGATFTKNPDIHGMYTERDDIILPSKIVGDEVNPNYLNPWSEMTSTSARERAAYFQYGWISGPIPVPFGKKEIIWIEAMKRTDDYYGFSPVQILQKSLQMLMYMVESDLDYYNDNNVPKGIIGLDDSDSNEIEAFKEQWFESQRIRDEFGNWKKIMHKVPITNKTPQFTRIEFSSSEMQVIEKQKWYTKMVWSSFGVTPTELGYTEEASGAANQIVQSKVFRKKAINPILRNLEASYNMHIVSEFEYTGTVKTDSGKTITRPKYKFVFKTFDIDDEKAKYELYNLQTESAIKTINEVRTEEGLEEVEWGNEPPKSWQGGGTENFFGGFGDSGYDRGYDEREDDAMDPDEPQEDVDQEQKSQKKNIKSFIKEAKSKYKRRWRGRDGKWQYEYNDSKPKTEKQTESQDTKKQGVDKETVKQVAKEVIKDIPEYDEDMGGCTGECANISEAIKTKLKEKGIQSKEVEVKPPKAGQVGSDHSALYLPDSKEVIDTQMWQFTPDKPGDIEDRKIVFTLEEYREKGFKIFDSDLKEVKAQDTYKNLSDAVVKALKENEQKILQIVSRELSGGVVKQIKSDLKAGIESKGLQDIIASIKQLMGLAAIKEVVTEIIRKNFIRGAEDSEEKINEVQAFNYIPDKQAIGFISDYTFDNIKDMNDEIANNLRTQMEMAFINGEGVAKIKERIKSVFDVGETRAKMIARTEANRAFNTGKLNAYLSSGIKAKKWIMMTEDDRTSDLSKQIHEVYGSEDKAIPIDVNFKLTAKVGKKVLLIDQAAPPFHPNERCTLIISPSTD